MFFASAGTECWKTQGYHYIKAMVSDKSNPANTVITSEYRIIIDTLAPTSGINYPFAAMHNAVPVISGTAADTPPGMEHAIVIHVLNLDTTRYYDGTGGWQTLSRLFC